jgi:hypothetical protein
MVGTERRGGGERIMLRANRYALAAALDGVALEPWVRALHGCNNPACMRVSRAGETGLLHVVGGSQRDNMRMMARARRGGGRPAIRTRGAGVAARRARAVALRDAVRYGWDADAVAAALFRTVGLMHLTRQRGGHDNHPTPKTRSPMSHTAGALKQGSPPQDHHHAIRPN